MKPVRRAEVLFILAFLGVIAGVPLIQLVAELKRGERPQVFELFQQKPTAANLRAYEHGLEDGSLVARNVRPWVQHAQFSWFGAGGEKVIIGRDGWLFYRPGVQFLTERSDARIGNSTAGEAVKAIVSFRDQLAARGIRLLVMPVPNKESVYPEKLSRRAGESPGVIAKDTQGILDGLRAAGVEVVDLFALFNQCKSADNKDPIYLARDSHWSPFGVELAAKAVADCILKKAWLEAGNSEYETKSVSVRRTGDVLRMLQVPSLERNIPADTIVCKQVVNCDSRQVYQDDPRSDVLVLGDSFLRIYETDEPGSAGFIAHLAKELGRSLSSIVNDGGASTLVRQELCRRPGLLLGKKLVIWEFVERDIRLGTEGWQLVQLPSLENSRQ